MDIFTRNSDLIARDYGVGGNGAHIGIPSIVGPVLAAVLVFNRLYWRIHLVRTLGIDDLCIGLSLVREYRLDPAFLFDVQLTPIGDLSLCLGHR
jgi:hypothetical protein